MRTNIPIMMQNSSMPHRFSGNIAVNLFVAVGCILAALFVAQYSSVYSSDADEYRLIYDSIAFDSIVSYSYQRSEFFYFLWNQAIGWFGVSFETFLFISTLLFLGLKLVAFRRLSHGASLTLIFLVYVALFFLLHESIQYKISWALAIAAWACVFISERRFVAAILLTGLAAGFHVTSVALPFAFFVSSYVFKSNASKIGLAVGAVLLYPVVPFLLEHAMDIIAIADPRYVDYISASRLANQNSSDLFYPYLLLMGLFVMYISYNAFRSFFEAIRAQTLMLYASVGILVLLNGYVSMASRLSDVLAVLLVPVLSNLLAHEGQNRWMLKSAIFFFCAVILVVRLHYHWGFFDFEL